MIHLQLSYAMYRALHSYIPVLYASDHQMNLQAVTMVVLYTVGGLEIILRPTGVTYVYWTTDYDHILLSRAATETVS